ncbi:hypothetical protein NIES2111_60050 (plasmid) [Nostoc sp. NIES-2111]|nr:hypothetical protein NIES2111_60050 [Nostoc sp. NIES-2111]
MKLITTLPDWSIHFEQITSDSKWHYVWRHKGSYLLRVCSMELQPWGKPCVINIREQKYKSDKIKFTNRIDLQILDINDTEHAVPGDILLETPFMGIPHSTQPTLRFYAIPCTDKKDIVLNIMLAVIPKE